MKSLNTSIIIILTALLCMSSTGNIQKYFSRNHCFDVNQLKRKGKSIYVSYTIWFDEDNAISRCTKDELKELITVVRKKKDVVSVIVEFHTANMKNEDYYKKEQIRLKAIEKYLIKKGLGELNVVGQQLKNSRPAAQIDVPKKERNTINKRVEFWLI